MGEVGIHCDGKGVCGTSLGCGRYSRVGFWSCSEGPAAYPMEATSGLSQGRRRGSRQQAVGIYGHGGA